MASERENEGNKSSKVVLPVITCINLASKKLLPVNKFHISNVLEPARNVQRHARQPSRCDIVCLRK